MNSRRKEKNSSLKKYIVAERYAGMTLEGYLKEVMSVSARQRQKLFFSRGVYVNGGSAHTKRLLKAGDMVAIRQFKDTGLQVCWCILQDRPNPAPWPTIWRIISGSRAGW